LADPLLSDLASLKIDRSERPPGRTWTSILVTLVVIGALVAGGFLAWQKYSPSVFKTEVATTEVMLVSPAQASTELTATGYVVAQRQTRVACQILGRIAEMKVKEGDVVKEHDLLFRIEDAALRAAASAAKSRSLAARARVQSATATLAELRLQLARDQDLASKQVGQASAAEDRLEQVHAAEANLEAAKLEADAVDEEFRQSEVQLGYAEVRAPFAGIVLGKPLDVGELVGTFTEKPAVELCDPTTLRAEIDVPEKRLDRVRIGGPVEIVLDAFPESRFRGAVEEIGSRVDRSKSTVVVKLRFLDKPPRLLPDMRTRAGFLSEQLDDQAVKEPPKLVVPRSAVADRGGAKVVFQIDEGHVRSVPVTLGPEFAGGYELRSGPPVGTVLVADPPSTLADGQPVKEKGK